METGSVARNSGNSGSAPELDDFEAPRAFVEASLRTFRMANTVLDALFYDVGILYRDLLERGAVIATQEPDAAGTGVAPRARTEARSALRRLDLSALANPEGAILIVDAHRAPYIGAPYRDVTVFLEHAQAPQADRAPQADETGPVEILAITGVGSSALGSVAFAWNISKALGKPVAAIVPGYGLADVVHQAMGGWFGFGLPDYFRSQAQRYLAATAPALALIGRNLLASIPGHDTDARTAAPVFRQGAVGSDTLHAILEAVPSVTRVVGHSKGALAIANAMRSLPPETADRISVSTFGCTIRAEDGTVTYDQFLGRIDALGILNSFGNHPGRWLFSHHSTNSLIPLSMSVVALLTDAAPERSGAPA